MVEATPAGRAEAAAARGADEVVDPGGVVEELAAAGRRRLPWADVPDGVRRLVEDRVGAVVGVRSHESGFSPGVASTLTTASGDRVFVKAVSTTFHARSAELYRREATVAAVLPGSVPAPRLSWVLDDGDWVVVAFDAVDGENPPLPWRRRDLALALETVTVLGRTPAPASEVIRPLSHGHSFEEWRALAAAGTDLRGWDPWVAGHLEDLVALAGAWREAAVGDALVHGDLRADNMLRARDRMLVVDWPYAASGAAWFDLVCMLPSVGLEGGGDPADIWADHPLGRDADPDAANAVLAAITGYFVHGSVQPHVAEIPNLRAYQRAQGEVALRWLRRRLR